MNNLNIDDISLAQQKYIEVIYELTETHGHAHTKTIAEKLNVKMPSVTEQLKKLTNKNIVNYKARLNVTLTSEGELLAKELDKRENVLNDLFHSVIGFSKEDSEKIACKVEHIIDEDFRCKLSKFVKFIDLEINKNGYSLSSAFAEYSKQKEKNNVS